MATQRERRQFISRIRNLPRQLSTALRGLDSAQLQTPYRAGGWTAAQVVHHLADSHLNAYLRMRLIAHEDHPTLKTYDQDVWASTPEAKVPQLGSSMAILRGLHRRWALFLQNLPREAWSRTGIHPERGPVSIDDLAALYAGHGEKHVGHIMALRERLGV
jgi:hypothetical protein